MLTIFSFLRINLQMHGKALDLQQDVILVAILIQQLFLIPQCKCVCFLPPPFFRSRSFLSLLLRIVWEPEPENTNTSSS